MKQMTTIIESFIQKPKKLFLIDGFGALISAFMLGIVLVKLESIFGIPKSSLYILASIPILFALYDFFCYFKIKNNISFYLKVIAIANILYCILSLAISFYHKESITILGWIYIFGEIAIVALIAYIELKVSAMINIKK